MNSTLQNMVESAEEHIQKIKEKIIEQNLVLFLDFDGTLSPIVENPQDAKILPCIRDSLETLTLKIETFIISGRSRLDVKEKVGIKTCKFVGAHGFDMSEIDSNEIVSKDVLDLLGKVFEKFQKEFGEIDGVILEDHYYTITLHYRKVKDPLIEDKLFEKVQEILMEFNSKLKITQGKKVIEIRPKINWNKGKAVEKILENYQNNEFCIYIGDDVTDEDAFQFLKESKRGIGIVIGKKTNTHASYSLEDPYHVSKFLKLLKK